MGDGWCSDATDDDGSPLWKTADGACIWSELDAARSDFYAAFAYDAVYVMAHAIERTLAASPGATEIDGEVLLAELLNTSYVGATGLVSFNEHGDRDTDVRYDVFNVGKQGTVFLGNWNSHGALWGDRFVADPSISYVSAVGSSTAPALADSFSVLRLGLLCEEAEPTSKVRGVRLDMPTQSHALNVTPCSLSSSPDHPRGMRPHAARDRRHQ